MNKKSFIFRGFDLTKFSDRFSIMWLVGTFVLLYVYSYIIVTQEFVHQMNLNFSLAVTFLSLIAFLIGREYHPEDSLTAVLSQIITSIAVLVIDPTVSINILVPLFVLFGIRVITKPKEKGYDAIGLILLSALAGYLTYSTESWIYFFLIGAGFFADSWLGEDDNKSWIFGMVSVAISIVWMFWKGSVRYVIYIEPLVKYALGVLVLLALAYGILGKKNNEKASQGPKFSFTQSSFARIFVFLSGLLVLFFGFSQSLATITPLIVVMLLYVPVHYFNK